MSDTFLVKHVTETIHRHWREVYDFAAAPENLTRWAAGLGQALEQGEGHWIVEGPLGRIQVRFAERNDFGVLDHWVTLPDGLVCYNPLRIVANGAGSEVTFTLYRLPGMSDEAYAADADAVARDLAALKALLEA